MIRVFLSFQGGIADKPYVNDMAILSLLQLKMILELYFDTRGMYAVIMKSINNFINVITFCPIMNLFWKLFDNSVAHSD